MAHKIMIIMIIIIIIRVIKGHIWEMSSKWDISLDWLGITSKLIIQWGAPLSQCHELISEPSMRPHSTILVLPVNNSSSAGAGAESFNLSQVQRKLFYSLAVKSIKISELMKVKITLLGWALTQGSAQSTSS